MSVHVRVLVRAKCLFLRSAMGVWGGLPLHPSSPTKVPVIFFWDQNCFIGSLLDHSKDQLISSTTLQVFYQSQKLLIHVHDSFSQTLIFMLMLWFSVFTLTESFTWIHVTFKLKQVNVEAGEQHLVSTDCIYTQTHVRRNKQQDLVSGPAVTLLAEKIWPQESKKLLYTEQILNFELRQNLKKKNSFVNI